MGVTIVVRASAPQAWAAYLPVDVDEPVLLLPGLAGERERAAKLLVEAQPASEPVPTIRVVRRRWWRRNRGGVWDLWLPPWAELIVGCALLVLSWEWFWETTGAIWQTWHNGVGTVAAVLSAWFIYRAWKRKPLEVRCDGCGDDVSLYETRVDDKLSHFVLDCPRCGASYYVPPQED